MTKPVKTPREILENLRCDIINIIDDTLDDHRVEIRRQREALDSAIAQLEEYYKPKYVSKYKDFEDYLMEVHGEQYVGTDDCMPDDFNKWIEDLGQDELIDYGNKFAKKLEEYYKPKDICTCPKVKGVISSFCDKCGKAIEYKTEPLEPIDEKELEKALLEAGVAGETTRRCLVLTIIAKFSSPTKKEN